MFYLLITPPPRLPDNLSGRGAGIGRRFLDIELSTKAATPSLWDAIEAEELENKNKSKR